MAWREAWQGTVQNKKMTTISKVRVGLESICPLLMDRYTGETKCKTTKEYIEAAENKCYRTEEGNLAIPANAIKAVIKNASSSLGKKMEGRKNRQMIAAGVFFNETMLDIGQKKHDGIVDHVVTRKGTGDKVTRVVTYRPIINKWKCEFEMNLIGVEPTFAKEALQTGGLMYGLLGYRPEFGRFIVKKFEVLQ